MARAVLYSQLRYPKTIKQAPEMLAPERSRPLLAWHEAEAVAEYKRHRHAAIAELQGNRNPLIDDPGWVERTTSPPLT